MENEERSNGQQNEFHDDEISLVDLWLVLVRRKNVIFGIVILCILTGLAYWATQSPQERYVTTIEVGRVVNDGGGIERIESRKVVENRLKNSALPTLRNEVARQFDVSVGELPRVSVQSPEAGDGDEFPGDFVFLQTTTSPENREIVDALHQGAVDFVSNSHDRLFRDFYERRLEVRLDAMELDLREMEDELLFRAEELAAETRLAEAEAELEKKKQAFPVRQKEREHRLERKKDELQAAVDAFRVQRQNLEHQLRRAGDRVDTLAENRERLEGRMARLSLEEELLAQQMEDLQNWLMASRDAQQRLYEGMERDADVALPTLLIGDQAENARKELANLRQRISIGLPERMDELDTRLTENRLAIQEAEEQIAELEAELSKREDDHARDLSERRREIAQMEESIRIAESEHNREVEALERRIERLTVDRDKIYAEHERKIEKKKGDIELFRTQMERMEATGAPAVAVPAESIGRGGKMILALSGVLGLMLGVFGAFFAEFVAVARETAARRENTEDAS